MSSFAKRPASSSVTYKEVLEIALTTFFENDESNWSGNHAICKWSSPKVDPMYRGATLTGSAGYFRQLRHTEFTRSLKESTVEPWLCHPWMVNKPQRCPLFTANRFFSCVETVNFQALWDLDFVDFSLRPLSVSLHFKYFSNNISTFLHRNPAVRLAS